MDLSLSFISILALILSVAAISFAFFIYKARGRGEVLLTQPYLEIDKVREFVNDDGRKVIQFRVINNNANPFQLEDFTLQGYDMDTDFQYGKPSVDNQGLVEHDVLYLNVYIEENSAFNARLLIKYTDFNGELHQAASVKVYVEGGEIAHDVTGSKFILRKRTERF